MPICACVYAAMACSLAFDGISPSNCHRNSTRKNNSRHKNKQISINIPSCLSSRTVVSLYYGVLLCSFCFSSLCLSCTNKKFYFQPVGNKNSFSATNMQCGGDFERESGGNSGKKKSFYFIFVTKSLKLSTEQSRSSFVCFLVGVELARFMARC
jgi:hypothetical protein